MLASKGDLVVSYEEKTLIMWDMKAGAQKATFTADKVRDTDGVGTRRAPYFLYGWGQYAQGTLLAVRMGSVRTGNLACCTDGVSTHREPCLLYGWGQYAQGTLLAVRMGSVRTGNLACCTDGVSMHSTLTSITFGVGTHRVPYFLYGWGRYAQGTLFPLRLGSVRTGYLISSTDGVGTHRVPYFHYVWGRYAQGTLFPVRVGSIRTRHLISSTDGVGTHRALYFHCSQTCVKGALPRF